MAPARLFAPDEKLQLAAAKVTDKKDAAAVQAAMANRVSVRRLVQVSFFQSFLEAKNVSDIAKVRRPRQPRPLLEHLGSRGPLLRVSSPPSRLATDAV